MSQKAQEANATLRETMQVIPLDLLDENPKNFFRPYSEDELRALAESIASSGLVHPLVVRPRENGRYEIISGHQRKRAAELARLAEVPCVVEEVGDDRAELMLVEANLRTRELSPMERARAIRRRKEILGIRQGVRSGATSEIVSEVGMTDRMVRMYDALNDLIPELQELVEAKKLGVAAASRMASKPPDVQRQLYDLLGEDISELTVEDVRRLKEESDRGYFVLGILKRRVEELESELKEIREKGRTKEELEAELARLRSKKRELEYDIADRLNAERSVETRLKSKGAAFLDLVASLLRPVQASLPDLEELASHPVDEKLRPHLLRWARVVQSFLEIIKNACRGE